MHRFVIEMCTLVHISIIKWASCDMGLLHYGICTIYLGSTVHPWTIVDTPARIADVCLDFERPLGINMINSTLRRIELQVPIPQRYYYVILFQIL